MKVLTVCQPWAWAIAEGLKTIENRTWATKYRGPLWIHAGKGLKYRSLLGRFDDLWKVVYPPQNRLEFGGIVCRVNLTDCLRIEEVRGQRFAEGPWCWILGDVQKVRFRPMAGKLGLWSLADPDQLATGEADHQDHDRHQAQGGRESHQASNQSALQHNFEEIVQKTGHLW